MDLKTGDNSVVASAEYPSPRFLLTRDELEEVLSTVLNDLWKLERPHERIPRLDQKDATGELSVNPFLPRLSQDELESALNVLVGNLWKPVNWGNLLAAPTEK